jgi:hypothetical protein
MATDPRVQFQLRPINPIPAKLAAFTQDYHALNKLLSLKPVDLSDGKISNDTCYEIIEQYEKRYEGETATEKRESENKARSTRIQKVFEEV